MKSYKQFIKESKNSIESICKEYGITNYTINEDGSIDVDGDVDLNNCFLEKIPLKFRNVTGHFNCSHNNLISLEGCPISVGYNFFCKYSKLTSLEGCPKNVGGNFYCGYNQLTSLEGCPESSDILHCVFNKITDFKGISEFFEGDLMCHENPIFEIYGLFRQNFNCIKWINEFDVIRGNKVVMDLLEEVFHQLNLEIPENIEFKNYEII